MSRKRTTKMKYGDRLQVYLNQNVDTELLNYMNKQSDLSGAVILGLLEMYEKYGDVDMFDMIPRRFIPNSNPSKVLQQQQAPQAPPLVESRNEPNGTDELQQQANHQESTDVLKETLVKEEPNVFQSTYDFEDE